MPGPRKRNLRLAFAASAAALLCLAAGWLTTRSPAHAASVGGLQQQISAGQGTISDLAGAVSAASGRLSELRSSIAGLEQQIARIQADLDAKRAQLLKLRRELAAARARLRRLKVLEARAERVLRSQLIDAYETDRPDIVSVVLESNGFQDLLERLSFARRIRRHDAHVVRAVRAARRAVAAQATRLGALEVRQQRLTAQVLEQRNSLASTKVSLVQEELAVARARARKARQLASARDRVSNLQQKLSSLQAQASRAAASSSSSGASFPSHVSSSGGFTFPLPKDAASPPGSWSEDQGVDISAPGDTPEYAVCSGTIVLHGIGGFGSWAPVLHCDSSVGGYDYVYYGHAGPANQLPDGTHVGAGEVMSSVGPGIVGISTGPHLEIGFCDSSGSPIGGGSASTMMSLLQGAY